MDYENITFPTYTGRTWQLFNPRPEDVCIEDIAHSLALTNRFNGHTPEPYSVAQHSVLCAWNAPKEHAFAALLHDAHEAYTGDVLGPIKMGLQAYIDSSETGLPCPPSAILEQMTQMAVAEAFGISCPMGRCHPEVYEIDKRALVTEARDLVCGWDDRMEWHVDAEPWSEKIVPWSWKDAENEFLQLFKAIKDGRF